MGNEHGVFRGRVVAVALLRHHVQQDWPLDLLGHRQILLQLPDAVAVNGPVVMQSQILEEHAAHKPGLHGVLHLVQEPLNGVADDRHAGEHLLYLGFQAGIQRMHADAIQRLGQSADPWADRHFVVVEYDNEVLFSPPA